MDTLASWEAIDFQPSTRIQESDRLGPTQTGPGSEEPGSGSAPTQARPIRKCISHYDGARV